MKNTIQLSVSSPCHEKWSTFNRTEHGGFCSSCNKEVIDFTQMSDAQILNYFSAKLSTSACGRFHPDQLKSYSNIPAPKINTGFTLFKAGVFSLLLVLISKPASAQFASTRTLSEVKSKADAHQETNTLEEEQIIKGVVKDQYDHQPIPGVNILLKGTTHGTVTDLAGQFEFPVKLQKGDVLVFSFIGYRTDEYTVKGNTSEATEIQLTLDVEIMGEVAVAGIYEHQPSFLGKLWTKVKAAF